MSMIFLQNPLVRSLFRVPRIKKFAYSLYSLRRDGYEEKFSNSLINVIRPGDCVWDVGANVGFYTRKFAEQVGDSGKVIAFEPFESTFQRLRLAVEDLSQVECLKLALGAAEEELSIEPVGSGRTTNSLMHAGVSPDSEQISVRTGELLIKGGCPFPTILKIDVEGFEEDVLWGFRNSLRDEKCRGVFIEVHYRLLEERGFLRAPVRLISMLKDLGFHSRWVDPSHLVGIRNGIR